MHTRFGKFVTAQFFPYIFLLIYLLVFLLSALNTCWAIGFLTGRRFPSLFVYAVFAVSAFLILTETNVSKKFHSILFKKTLRFLSCFYIYYTFLQLHWNLLALLFLFSSRIRAAGTVLCLGLSAVVVLAGYLHAQKVKVKRYELPWDGSRDIRLALMSDIHLGLFVGERQVRSIVEAARSLHPDLTVIAGDLFDEEKSVLNTPDKLQHICSLFRSLTCRYGVYAVAGNHDPKVSDVPFRRFLESSGIHLLDDEVKLFSDFNLAGRTDGFKNTRAAFSELHPQPDPEKATIVLDHNPQNVPDDVENRAALVLCGHTHKGQLFPVTLLTRWAAGRDYFYGHTQHGSTHVIITSGAGFFGLPVRIGTDSEVVEIVMKSTKPPAA